MTDDDLLRRDVLLALGATGAASAGAGAGSFGAFLDRQGMGASFQAGGVDLVVHYEGNGEAVTVDSGGVGAPELTLPDPTESTPTEARFCFELKGNPAYVWLCPGIDLDICSAPDAPDDGGLLDDVGETVDGALGELGEVLELSLAYCDVDGSESASILTDSLCGFLGQYAGGFPLDGEGRSPIDPGNQAPFQPTDAEGSNPCLCLSLSTTGDLPAELGTVSLGLNLRFHAVQARHNDGETGPCDAIEAPPTPTPTDGDGVADGISFVAFCADEGTLTAADVERLTVREVGVLEWETARRVNHVVLKTGEGDGRGIEVFTYPDGARSGTIRTDHGDLQSDRTEPEPCLDGESGVKIERAEFSHY